jgi:bacillithiol system protein YtxJ
MAEYKILTSIEGVDQAIKASFERPVVLFKHSTSCPISSMAKSRVDRAFQSKALPFDYYHLDLLRHRQVSAYIAETLGVRHESPQAIVVSNGKAIYHSSHLDIDPAAMAGLSA